MESRSGDHGRGLKPLPPWTATTTPPAGHNFSLDAGCFPWPAQIEMRSLPMSSSSCYTCGYCRREFRSAQALGGHMNVHRRDRARLRQRCCSAAAHGPSSPLPSSSLVTAHRHQHSRAPALPNLDISPPHRAADGSMAAADPVIYVVVAAIM